MDQLHHVGLENERLRNENALLRAKLAYAIGCLDRIKDERCSTDVISDKQIEQCAEAVHRMTRRGWHRFLWKDVSCYRRGWCRLIAWAVLGAAVTSNQRYSQLYSGDDATLQ